MTSPFGKKVMLIALLTGIGLVVVIVLGVVVYFLVPGGLRHARMSTPLAVPIFIGLGFGLLVYAGDLQRKNREERRSWRRTTGVITESRIEKKQDPYGEEITFHPRVTYEYTVDGITYTGDRTSYSESGTVRRGRAQDIVKALRVGTKATVYYNRDSPADSIVKSGRQLPVSVFVLLGLLLLLTGTWAGVDLVTQILKRFLSSTS